MTTGNGKQAGSILAQLDQPSFRPSKADRKLIAYMKSHPEEIPVSTIAALAEHVGVAEATVTRFVKKMGFESLNLFKVLFAKEFSKYKDRQIISRGIEHDEPALVTGRKLLDAYYDTLDRTYVALPEGVVERSAAALQQAARIIFVGLGNSGFMAMDAAYKFFRIGLPSESSDNSHAMVMKAALSDAATAFVAVSHSGETPEVIEALRIAKANGARTIVITSERTSPLAQLADTVVPYVGRETLLETGSVSVKMAQIFILDLIYTQIVKDRAERAAESKRRTALAVAHLR